ncbi:MAG: T9SS type A sorting domain-containing protein [Bacteroidia bacterium]|nr:T9SS type A sorting domain-containing protein [Bacteroidia bacterium]
MLPDSASDPEGSKGQIIFAVKANSNTPDGTIVFNRAGIYFDYNEVVFTNTTHNMLFGEPYPVAAFDYKHSCNNTGLVYDFIYSGGVPDGAIFEWNFGADAVPSSSTQENPFGVIFSGTGTREITLTVTRYGCSTTITKIIDIVDVKCGNNKVLVCHIPPGNPGNPQTICIAENALPAHLAHGDCLGPCQTNHKNKSAVPENENKEMFTKHDITQNTFEVFPNPFTEKANFSFTIQKTNFATIEIANSLGQTVATLYNGFTASDETYTIEFDSKGLNAGVYYCILRSADFSEFHKLVIIK